MSGADIGLIGLAVMGQNLVLNMADNGYRVAVYNRTEATTTSFVDGVGAEQASKGNLVASSSLAQLVDSLAKPRKIMLMVKAGPVVDKIIDDLVPLLDDDDIIIDGGNSLFSDSERRQQKLENHNLLFVGAGVSGGELGARFGPSIMPGGSPEARTHLEPLFKKISAKADDGEPCSSWLGPGGSGHFVKMVHNGIEYGDMQVLAEAYSLLQALGHSVSEIAKAFTSWKSSEMDSYLVDISADILGHTEPDGTPTLDIILDAAGQKGTGRWTVTSALNHGQPLSLVAEAVMARQVSAMVEQRQVASKLLPGPTTTATETAPTGDEIRDAAFAAKIISYAQGFMLLKEASNENGWDLDLGTVAATWRGGCIIRAGFLDDITNAYRQNPDLSNLLFDDFFVQAMTKGETPLRKVVSFAAANGVPTPGCSSALSFYDSFRSPRTSANLIQAQRDYFGAHTYERTDRPRGQFFHTDWTGTSGPTTSTSYDA